MPSTPDLLGVPPELFERIAQFAHDSDLLALRLTSKDAASKVLRTFTETHFSHRHILFTEEQNLSTAIEVAKHPVFGPALNILWLYVDEVKLETDPDFPKFYNKQRALMESGRDLHLLTVLFAHLRRHGVHPDIRIFPDAFEVSSKLPVSSDYKTPHFGIGVWSLLEPPEPDDHRPFLKIIEALSLSLLKPSALIVSEETCNVVINHLTDQHLTHMAEALRRVKTLQLSTVSFPNVLSSEQVEKFCSLLSNELDLTDLLLRVEKMGIPVMFDEVFAPRSDDEFLVEELFKKQFTSLKTLQLDGARFEGCALVDFIHRHPAIHTLELDRIFPFSGVDPDDRLNKKDFDALLQQLTTVVEISVSNTYPWGLSSPTY